MNKFTTLLIILIVCISCSEPSKIIHLDGVIDTEEWKGSEEYQLNEGNKILLLQKDHVLYIALIAKEDIWSHLYLSDGKTIKVMHASAALDAIHYTKNKSLWLTKENFKYQMRDTIYNDKLQQKMDDYYTKNGWVANNVNLGNRKTIEFKIDLSSWKQSLYLSCVFANMNMNIFSFPKELKDHTVLPRLVQGYAVDSLSFEPSTWMKVK